ncbi:uncharacterized protein PV07_06992 [Cladophialophora immunda]|uniref:ABM domain-containing protein n=1 Tax=Cladophialophora immunda TaxID=569365 RepID=A0A0D2CUD1_9EURO|nr:uncharacterized protein PV07_06992 [Cladophialophora immunda]KIW27234.1 hypothetical protein PV07_06992 [Cladophialophora immunda]
MKEPFYIMAIRPPVIEAIQPFTEYVQANEPGCLHYQMFQPADAEPGNGAIIFIEQWKDMEALEQHRAGEQYRALMARAKNEGLLTGPPDVKVLQPVGGFGPR